jgi:hypothetical protein
MHGGTKRSQKYSLKNKLFLQFASPEVESAYKAHVNAENAGRVNLLAKSLLFVLVILHTYEFLVLESGSTEFVASFSRVVVFVRTSWFFVVVMLNFAPQGWTEAALCIVQTYLLCSIAGMNAFRLTRLSIIDKYPDSNYSQVRLNCDYDLAIHSRDAFLLLWIVFGEALFNAIVPIRLIFSWIPLACVSVFFSTYLIFPSLRLDDGGGTALLLIFLISCSSLIWVSGFMNEKRERKLWALNRMREAESAWPLKLVELVFPLVVSVEDGNMKPLSQVQEHFGDRVHGLADLETLRDDGSYSLEIQELVNEVEATGMPSKRNSVIRPFGMKRSCGELSVRHRK